MEPLMDLKGSRGSKLTLWGAVIEEGKLYALGYLLRDPSAKTVTQKLPLDGAPGLFMTLESVPPTRRGRIFRTENGQKWKSRSKMEVDKIIVYAVNMTDAVVFEEAP
jgi:hypothetical protein